MSSMATTDMVIMDTETMVMYRNNGMSQNEQSREPQNLKKSLLKKTVAK
jgi:hypothetical protein